ncbi:Uncharacterised protein [Klebsiella pneumoniae]|nr:Uncharacterised protein [Klebsiella pneumoniae]
MIITRSCGLMALSRARVSTVFPDPVSPTTTTVRFFRTAVSKNSSRRLARYNSFSRRSSSSSSRLWLSISRQNSKIPSLLNVARSLSSAIFLRKAIAAVLSITAGGKQIIPLEPSGNTTSLIIWRETLLALVNAAVRLSINAPVMLSFWMILRPSNVSQTTSL